MTAVALMHGEAGSAPSGTGSFSYFSNFAVLVENTAFEKVVGIWGHNASTDAWSFFPCAFSNAVPGNQEVWKAHVNGTQIDQFDANYQVSGDTYWDNNAGANYTLNTSAAHTDGIGTVALNRDVMAVSWNVDAGGVLTVEILLRNIAFAKQVAIVYTTDNWLTSHDAFGIFQRTFSPATAPHQVQAELWEVRTPVGAGKHGQFAAFYSAADNTYWDNNFGENYSF